MPEMPIISLLTLSCNQGEFLAETIESIISQAGDFFIDYIIIDCDSSDDSSNIIRKYDELLSQTQWQVKCGGITCRWLSEKNQGQADTLMKGFRLAEGEIFAWLNSGDVYLPGTLQVVADFFRNDQDRGLLYGDAEYYDANGSSIGRHHTEEFVFHRLAWSNFICQPAAFFRSDVFHGVGGLDTTLRFAVDYDLWLRITRQFPGFYLHRLLARSRLYHPGGTDSPSTLPGDVEEALSVTLQQFGWAPWSRIYTACRARCKARLPSFLAKNKTVVIVAATLCTLARSLLLTRKKRKKEPELYAGKNFEQVFKRRVEVISEKNRR